MKPDSSSKWFLKNSPDFDKYIELLVFLKNGSPNHPEIVDLLPKICMPCWTVFSSQVEDKDHRPANIGGDKNCIIT